MSRGLGGCCRGKGRDRVDLNGKRKERSIWVVFGEWTDGPDD